MKKSLKAFALLITFILLTNCENENSFEVPVVETNEKSLKINTVSLSDIPQMGRYLETKINTNFSKSTEVDGAIFNHENILEVIDTLNQANYTFSFSYPDTPIGTFYNLIVGRDSDGVINTPYVVKYVCEDAQVDTYVTNNFDFKYFRGNVELYKYTDYFQLNAFAKSDPICPPSYDLNGNPIPCNTVGVDGGGAPGGGDADSSVNNPGGDDTTYNSTGDPNPGGDGSSSSNNNSNSSTTGTGITYIGTSGAGKCPTFRQELNSDGSIETIVEYRPCSEVYGQSAPPDTAPPASTKIGGDDCPECGGSGGSAGVLPISGPTSALISILGVEIGEDLINIEISIQNKLLIFLIQNNESQEAKDFVEASIDILSEKEVISNNPLDYENAILKMTKHLKDWGDPEDEFLAEYIESTIPDFPSMTLGDVQDIYQLVRTQNRLLIIKYAEAVIVPFAEAAFPFVVYAVTEATLGAALPLLARIPIGMVARGARLNKMLKSMSKMGTPISGNEFFRKVAGSSAQKALKLFQKLSKNAVSPPTTNSQGTIVANMGDNVYLTYRTVSDTPGVIATIDINAPSLFSQIVKLKFYP